MAVHPAPATMQRFLPYGRQTIDDDDVAAVAAALRSDFLTTGPLVGAFETAFAAATGARHAIACNSGTAALHLAALALDLREGDVAIVPAVTFLSTANVVRMTGAEVVFADVDPWSGLLTPESLEAACAAAKPDAKLRATFPVHLNGQVCDMRGLAEVAKRRNLQLVEDACHALGVEGIGATKHSAIACFSTHPVKAIATGEGGVVTTADAKLAARMRRLCSHGMTRDATAFENRALAFDKDGQPNPWYYEMVEIGWNYRMPDVLCALGISQLRKLDKFAARRREIAALYERLLPRLAPAIRPVAPANVVHGWHLYAIHVDFRALGTTRARVMRALREEGIGTQVHYIPLHRQPYYSRRYGEISLPGAEAYYEQVLSIPMFPSMSDGDVERVVSALSRIGGNAG
jgi:UDP-4-amino-4,6-dideoxy-N-acetyl-beta-L-altrosamine transaminase